MSLTSSLYSGISGLTATGNSMQIIGDNIANANTYGFKSSSYSFSDLLSQTIATQSGTAQIGRGAALNDISTDWNQESFETTDNATDLAISGDGFFIVQDPDSEQVYYTRSGEFSFDNDGNLVNSLGYTVQGWELNEDGEATGSVTDITLDSFTSPPKASSNATLVTNLNSGAESLTTSLTSAWDGTADPAIDSATYSYQTSFTVYDSLGNTHDVTAYFDKSDTIGEWEYILTCDPSEDLSGNTGANLGLMASGTLTFSDSSGELTGMTLATNDNGTWTDATYDAAGYLEFSADFLGGASTAQSIAMNFGTRWNGTTLENDSSSTTQYASESSTTYYDADGYGAGSLQSIAVATDGAITGTYSNGATIPLYQIALADFVNMDGLTKLGGSLYAATTESGSATTNFPGTSGLGSISTNSLEQSNVDLASEFVKMIQMQRSYEANSKIITTVDEMLSNTISMKR